MTTSEMRILQAQLDRIERAVEVTRREAAHKGNLVTWILLIWLLFRSYP